MRLRLPNDEWAGARDVGRVDWRALLALQERRRAQMTTRGVVRVVALWLASSAVVLDVVSAQSTELWGTRLQVSCCAKLEQLDLASGQQVDGWAYPSLSTVHRSLTVHADRFVSINDSWPMDRVVRLHPADGVRSEVPLSGTSVVSALNSLVSDPSSDTLYFASHTTLFSLDPATGQATFVGTFFGSPYSWDVVTCMAMDASGVTYALGYHDGSQHYAVYTVGLATAQLSWAGEVTLPSGGGGYFLDLAIPPSGDWWASCWDLGLAPANRGLWRITPGTFQATQVRHIDPPYDGLAFLPPTQQSSYCTAKTNSLGCAPTISGDGFPSPTASSGYTIRATDARNQNAGALVFGVSGPAATPFAGGVFCVAAPWRRTTVLNSQGTPLPTSDCSGAWQLDFNTWMSQHVALPAGVSVRAQWLGRDNGFLPPNNWTLSDALEFVVRP